MSDNSSDVKYFRAVAKVTPTNSLFREYVAAIAALDGVKSRVFFAELDARDFWGSPDAIAWSKDL